MSAASIALGVILGGAAGALTTWAIMTSNTTPAVQGAAITLVRGSQTATAKSGSTLALTVPTGVISSYAIGSGAPTSTSGSSINVLLGVAAGQSQTFTINWTDGTGTAQNTSLTVTAT